MTQLIASGIAMGCIYALVGLAFVLIYNASSGLNFSQGEFVMLGAFVFSSAVSAGMPSWQAILLTLMAIAALSWIFQKLLFYPLKDRSYLYFVVATVAFSIIARNGALAIWGPNPLMVQPMTDWGEVTFGNVVLQPEHLIVIIVTAALLIGQYLLFYKTDLGRCLRASAQNSTTAELMGIYPRRMIGVTFAIAGAISGAAGVLLAPIFLVDTDMGSAVLLKAFIAVVIGGFGSIPGVVLGGVLVGLLESLSAVFISSTYKDAICLIVLVVFLMFFPKGILGEAVGERG
jgi:branched-chain amino acid transport system permease protein